MKSKSAFACMVMSALISAGLLMRDGSLSASQNEFLNFIGRGIRKLHQEMETPRRALK
jgi:hypothetical protein